MDRLLSQIHPIASKEAIEMLVSDWMQLRNQLLNFFDCMQKRLLIEVVDDDDQEEDEGRANHAKVQHGRVPSEHPSGAPQPGTILPLGLSLVISQEPPQWHTLGRNVVHHVRQEETTAFLDR